MSYLDEVNSTLEHYGILGMKWGVRRYQNPDGTLTAAGKKRYASSIAKTFHKNRKARFADQEEAVKSTVFKMMDKPSEKRLEKARTELLAATPTYDYSKIMDETYSLLEKDYAKFEKIAKKNGYGKDEIPVWQDVFDAAEDEVLLKYPDIKQQEQNWGKALDKYISEVGRISSDMLGDFSEVKIDPSNQYSSTIGKYVEGILLSYPNKRQ